MADVIFVKAVACSLSASHFGSSQIAWKPSQLGTKKVPNTKEWVIVEKDY